MPEGPSMVILKEEVAAFKGKKVTAVGGTTIENIKGIKGQKITAFKTWGKHFIMCFSDNLSIRIHFLLFGKYSINEARNAKPKLYFKFGQKQLNFYACSVKRIEENLNDVYDWTGDIMNARWDAKKARKKLRETPDTLVCDAILDQTIFAGAGNIIKNEVLFRIRVHPKSKIGKLPARKLTELINETRNYSFDFLKWKKEFTLKKHWLAHTKKTCPRCNIPIIKEQSTGKTKRRSFYCKNCQILYK